MSKNHNNTELSDTMLEIAATKLFDKSFSECDMFQKNTCAKQVMAFLNKSLKEI